MAYNEYDDYNQNPPNPTVSAIASFSFILGLAAIIGFYPLASGPVAIGFGIWSMVKGARGYQPIIGIAGGTISFGWKIIRLVLAFL